VFLVATTLLLGYGVPVGATSFVSLAGSPQDAITGGNTYNYSGSDGYFTPFWSSDGFVHLEFTTNDDVHLWIFTFAGPIVGNTFTGPLQTNLKYNVDANLPMDNYNSANLDFAGDHHTYGMISGDFTLYDLAIQDNVLQSLAVQFDVTSVADSQQSVSGCVWMNSDAARPTDCGGSSIPVPEPATPWLIFAGLGCIGFTRFRQFARNLQ
jgi:hypothetical protein